MACNDWLKRNIANILTCVGAGGMVATAIMAAKATPQAQKVLREAREANREHSLTKAATIQAVAPVYSSTIVTGVCSLVCIFGANALNCRKQASMAAAYTALLGAFEGYRNKVRTVCGPGTDEMILRTIDRERKDQEENRPPWNELQTFYLSCDGCAPKFFERTMEQIVKAEYEANRRFILKGSLSLNEFLNILDLPVSLNGDALGWDQYIGETLYGYQWIDFNHRYFVTDDGLSVCAIDMPFEAHTLAESDG